MKINSEAIYGTRPWKVYGDGPSISAAAQNARAGGEHHQAGAFNERNRKPLTAAEIRFTQKGKALYAFAMGRPEGAVRIPALAPGGQHGVGKIQNVEMVGAPGKLNWKQGEDGLTVEAPSQTPSEYAVVLKIAGA